MPGQPQEVPAAGIGIVSSGGSSGIGSDDGDVGWSQFAETMKALPLAIEVLSLGAARSRIELSCFAEVIRSQPLRRLVRWQRPGFVRRFVDQFTLSCQDACQLGVAC